MICQSCLKNTAQFHSPKLVNSQIMEVHLCLECAKKRDVHDISNGIEDKLQFLLEGLIHSSNNHKNSTKEVKCSKCSTTLSEFNKSGLAGCSQCYQVFSDVIYKYMQNMGITYSKDNTEKFSNNILCLKRELKKAVELENFEEAARLRDKLFNYEKGLSQ